MAFPSLYIRLVKKARNLLRSRLVKRLPLLNKLLRPLARKEYFRGNLPIAVGACWISNPVTIPPLVFGMIWIGSRIDRMVFNMPEWKTGVYGLDYEIDIVHFFTGCLSMGALMAVLSYPILYVVLKVLDGRRKRKQNKAIV